MLTTDQIAAMRYARRCDNDPNYPDGETTVRAHARADAGDDPDNLEIVVDEYLTRYRIGKYLLQTRPDVPLE